MQYSWTLAYQEYDNSSTELMIRMENMVARKLFYSFHFQNDSHRVARIRNISRFESVQPLKDNDWEKVKAGGTSAIEKWIDDQMWGTSCVVVLIGSQTAQRKFVKYEIKKAWEAKKGILGVHIHRLVDLNGNKTQKGANPFEQFTVGRESMSSLVSTYDPPNYASADIYAYISENLPGWVEKAISDRS